MRQSSDLLGGASATVIGAPSGFDLIRTLRRASEVRFAVAYSHVSGWTLLRPAFSRGTGRTYLLTGLDFCQTEPEVLESWLRLQRAGLAEARIWNDRSVAFHPKVMIIDLRKNQTPCALVGSGNLSAGGLRDNVECFLYTRDHAS